MAALPLILGVAAIAALAVKNKQDESSVVKEVRDHDRVVAAQMLLRAWMNQQGIHDKAYSNDPWPSRPGLGFAQGEAQGDPDDPVFRAALHQFQMYANAHGISFRPAGEADAQSLHADGMLDTATLGVLSAHSALNDPRPITSSAAASPAAFVPYQPGTSYYIAYVPGTLEHVMDSWSPTTVSVTGPGGMVPTKMIFDPTHPNPPPMPDPPASSPAAWIAALHAGKVIAIATYHGPPGAPANPLVEVFAIYPGPMGAAMPAPPMPGPIPAPPNAPTPPIGPPTAATGYYWNDPVVFSRWPGPNEYGANFVQNSWPGYHGYGHGEMSPWHRW